MNQTAWLIKGTLAVLATGFVATVLALCPGTPNAHAEVDDSGSIDWSGAAAAYAQATPGENGSCLTCHTDVGMLGEDAEIYLVDDSYAQSLHGVLGCTYCHGGDASATSKEEAMEGVDAQPSAISGANVCSRCHEDVTEVFPTSMHYTTNGLETGYCTRLAKASDELGEDLAAQNYRGAGCPDCHVECGQCHVREAGMNYLGEPYTGLIDGHNFVSAGSNDEIANTCMVCHVGNITDCFSQEDVHGPSVLNMSCIDCHALSDIHGDGTERTDMSDPNEEGHAAVTATCEACHDPSELEGEWHSANHLAGVSCEACHSGTYRNCYSCHGYVTGQQDGDEIQVFEYTGPTYAVDESGVIQTFAHIPVDEGMLNDAGVTLSWDQLNTMTSWHEGYNHATVLPEVNQDFCNRCHGEGTSLLTEDMLQFPDYEEELVIEPLPAVDVNDYTQD